MSQARPQGNHQFLGSGYAQDDGGAVPVKIPVFAVPTIFQCHFCCQQPQQLRGIGGFEGRGAVNFLALDSRRVSEEGEIVDPSSIVDLPVVDGRLAVPQRARSPDDGFFRRIQASGRKWVVLTDPDGKPHLLLNADRFLREVSSEKDADPRHYCVQPIITDDPQATLEQTLMNAELTEKHPSKKGLILFWGKEKRIIAHAGILRRLFEGVLSSPPSPEQRAPAR